MAPLLHRAAITRAIFKVTQGHRFWYQSKAHIRLPIPYLLSCTVTEIWPSIGPKSLYLGTPLVINLSVARVPCIISS